MRSQSEVLEKYEELRARKLRERLDKLLRRSYLNCIHNTQLNVRQSGKVGFCQNPKLLSERKKVLVCNDDAFCSRCAHYRCKYTQEMVEKDFDDIIRSPSRCGDEYPKLAVLIWVLQSDVGVGIMKSTGRRALGLLRRLFRSG